MLTIFYKYVKVVEARLWKRKILPWILSVPRNITLHEMLPMHLRLVIISMHLQKQVFFFFLSKYIIFLHYVNELLLLLISHAGEAEVLAEQLPFQAVEGVRHHPLHLASLGPGAGGGQAQAPDAAACPHTG